MPNILRAIEVLVTSFNRSVRLKRISDKLLAALLDEHVSADLKIGSLADDVVTEAAERLKRRDRRFGEPDPVSPIDCKHDRILFVCSSSGGPPSKSHHVSVCADCGQFRVSASNTTKAGDESVRTVVTFDLATDEAVRAAGQYARYLKREEDEDQ